MSSIQIYRICFALLFSIIFSLGSAEQDPEIENVEGPNKSADRDPKFIKNLLKFPLDSIKLRVVNQPELKPMEQYHDCITKNGTKLHHGESIKVFCDTWYCHDGEVIKPEPPMFHMECPDDFVIKPGLGCVKQVNVETTWCEARRICFGMGADLVSLDGNAELNDQTPFNDYLDGTGYDYWVGMCRTNSDFWDWNIGDGQIQENSLIWSDAGATPDPNEPTQFACVRVRQPGYYLSDRQCDNPAETHRFICEVPGFGKK